MGRPGRIIVFMRFRPPHQRHTLRRQLVRVPVVERVVHCPAQAYQVT